MEEGYRRCRRAARRKEVVTTNVRRRSDGVVGIDERRFQAESLGQEGADGPDAEGLGGVVAAGQVRDAELVRLGPGVLLRLARDEGVEPQRGGLREAPPRAAGADADAADLRRPAEEQLDGLAGELAEGERELLGGRGLGQGPVDGERRAATLGE